MGMWKVRVDWSPGDSLCCLTVMSAAVRDGSFRLSRGPPTPHTSVAASYHRPSATSACCPTCQNGKSVPMTTRRATLPGRKNWRSVCEGDLHRFRMECSTLPTGALSLSWLRSVASSAVKAVVQTQQHRSSSATHPNHAPIGTLAVSGHLRFCPIWRIDL